MSDVTQAGKPPRESIAERIWVDDNGTECEQHKATGFTYVWRATGRKFTYNFSDNQTKMMHAIFGGITRAGNIANTWKNLPDADKGADPIDEIADTFKFCDDNGLWGEERVGGPGSRFDKDALAKALAQCTGRDVAEFLTKLQAGEKVTPKDSQGNPEKREILYGTWALRNPLVKAAYEKLVPAANAPDVSAL